MAVSTLAVFSLATGAFFLWLDVSFLGAGAERILPVLWALASLAALPALRARKPLLTRALLWPTYLLLAVLAADMVKYAGFWWFDRLDADWPVPMGLWAGLLLILWAWSTERRLRGPAARNRFRAGGLLVRGLWLLVCAAGATGFFWLHLGGSHPPTAPVDVAVVLGHRVLPNGQASVTLRDRTLVAIELYRRGLARNILVSGSIDPMPDGHRESEVLAMAEVCRQYRIPEAHLFIDPVGVNTRATAYNARRLMERHGWRSVVACSSDTHLARTRMAFAEAGLSAFTVGPSGLSSLTPSSEWRQADLSYDLREAVGLVVYRLFPNYRPAKVTQMNIASPRLCITKSAGTLELFDGARLVKTYACITGANRGDKEHEGDRKTPEGSFHIVWKNPASRYHLSLALDYPDEKDAERGLSSGQITREQYDMILRYRRLGDLSRPADQKRYWKTPLGGEIFLHGHGQGRQGTAGCVAVSNQDIEELYALCEVGTPVEIRP